MDDAVFEALGDGRFVASELARGPWDPGAQHGGAPAALLMREFERLPADPGLEIARGRFYEPGPATAWFRLTRPIVGGEQPSGLQRLAAAADFPNGIASELSWEEYVFINPDLTLYVEREPAGEWICLDARMTVVRGGVGLSEAILFDERGRVGRATQALLVAPRG